MFKHTKKCICGDGEASTKTILEAEAFSMDESLIQQIEFASEQKNK